jgi:ATP-grasp domain, R2K clade family 3
MRLLFPSDPFDRKNVDENFHAEYDAAQSAELSCSLFSAEDIEQGRFNPRPDLGGDEIVYRGWMLSPDEYRNLELSVAAKSAKLITNSLQYRTCHYLPEWYERCKEFTPKTVFAREDDDFFLSLAGLDWSAYFVKDYVKSLTTKRGSVAKNIEEIGEIVEQIRKYRGRIEGGVCIREFENLLPETEERYFAFRGKVFSRNDTLPLIAQEIASRIDCPFFSIDIVSDVHGKTRLIELGDGQVSDSKRWRVEKFVQIFARTEE